MTVVSFPGAVEQVLAEAKAKLDEWPWDKDLGKPYSDINGPERPEIVGEALNVRNPSYIGEAPPPNDLARYKEDNINSPAHYKHLGVECIEMTEGMSFCLGNVVKYVYRCNLKGGIEDLRKAKWYLEREIARREND